MVNDEVPVYTREELEELFEIIFLGHAKPKPLVLMDRLVFIDQDRLQKELIKEAHWIKEKTQHKDIEEVLFCKKSRLPLLLNHRFYKVVNWRLAHGK